MPAKHAAPVENGIDRDRVIELIARIEGDLERLKGLLDRPTGAFDPADPHNKTCDGKLTPQGVECCYRMFDEGKSRYSVARQMRISFAAATHRFATWAKAGGQKRKPLRLG
jgi:hypothetical protein